MGIFRDLIERYRSVDSILRPVGKIVVKLERHADYQSRRTDLFAARRKRAETMGEISANKLRRAKAEAKRLRTVAE